MYPPSGIQNGGFGAPVRGNIHGGGGFLPSSSRNGGIGDPARNIGSGFPPSISRSSDRGILPSGVKVCNAMSIQAFHVKNVFDLRQFLC